MCQWLYDLEFGCDPRCLVNIRPTYFVVRDGLKQSMAYDLHCHFRLSCCNLCVEMDRQTDINVETEFERQSISNDELQWFIGCSPRRANVKTKFLCRRFQLSVTHQLTTGNWMVGSSTEITGASLMLICNLWFDQEYGTSLRSTHTVMHIQTG